METIFCKRCSTFLIKKSHYFQNTKYRYTENYKNKKPSDHVICEIYIDLTPQFFLGCTSLNVQREPFNQNGVQFQTKPPAKAFKPPHQRYDPLTPSRSLFLFFFKSHQSKTKRAFNMGTGQGHACQTSIPIPINVCQPSSLLITFLPYQLQEKKERGLCRIGGGESLCLEPTNIPCGSDYCWGERSWKSLLFTVPCNSTPPEGPAQRYHSCTATKTHRWRKIKDIKSRLIGRQVGAFILPGCRFILTFHVYVCDLWGGKTFVVVCIYLFIFDSHRPGLGNKTLVIILQPLYQNRVEWDVQSDFKYTPDLFRLLTRSKGLTPSKQQGALWFGFDEGFHIT